MKKILIALIGVFLAYSAFKRADAVQAITFRGDSYTLVDQYSRTRADVYMYTPGGENFQRAGKYIQIAHLPKVELQPEEYRKQYMKTLKRAPGFAEISDESFFYIEANTLVHSMLVQDGDRFKLYAYAEILPDGASSKPGEHRPEQSIAYELEDTIRALPQPPRVISTWF